MPSKPDSWIVSCCTAPRVGRQRERVTAASTATLARVTADVEKPKPAAFYYVIAASLLVLVLEVYPWPPGFIAQFFNGFDTNAYESHGSWVETGKPPYVD